MKKTVNANIGGRVVSLEEDAFAVLTEYLESIKRTLAENPDRDEIIKDVEAAMAEHLRATLSSYKESITVVDVETLKETMGEPAAYHEPDTDTPPDQKPMPDASPEKKVYRNPDNAMIAGVASGLAAYFGIDPVIVRLLFVLTTIFGGWGLAVYIVLWIVMPEAKTTADKLRMHGRPVTLEKIEEYAHKAASKAREGAEQMADVVKKKDFGRGVNSMLRGVGPVLRILIGAFLVLLAFSLLVGSAIFFFGVFFRPHHMDIPLDIPTLTAPYTPLLAGGAIYALIALPALFILLMGLSLITRRRLIALWFAVGMLLLWGAAIVAAGIMAFDIVPNIHELQRYHVI